MKFYIYFLLINSVLALNSGIKITKNLISPKPICQEGIDNTIKVLESGKLFRYGVDREDSYVSKVEKEFAQVVNKKNALCVNSCSSAIVLGLKLLGANDGDEILTNGFTFTAVPSSIMRLNCKPILVDTTKDFTISLEDLEYKMKNSKAKILALSHMRGYITDMDKILSLCQKYNVILFEDCAHCAGVMWKNKPVGINSIAAYSTQSDKIINSGEGGILALNDDDMFAKAIYLSGCYEEQYVKHHVDSKIDFEKIINYQPNWSMRMTELTAAVLLPQIKNMNRDIKIWTKNYNLLCNIITKGTDKIYIPKSHENANKIGDHINFSFEQNEENNALFFKLVKELGVPIKWLQSNTNARWYKNWEKYGVEKYSLPGTDKLLAKSYDMKLGLDLTEKDINNIGKIIVYAAEKTSSKSKIWMRWG